MSLLDICQQVASEVPIAAPSTIVGNPDATAKLLLALAQAAGEWVARRPDGGWVNLIREYDFQTAAKGPFAGTLANTGPNGVAQITLASTSGIAANSWYAFGPGLPTNTIVQTINSPTLLTLNNAATNTGVGTFTFGQSDYTLPADFRWVIDDTLWDRTRYWEMRGPLSPQEWQAFKSSTLSNASIQRRFRFRYKNGAQVFSVDPTPQDNGSYLVFEYMSKAWCASSLGVPQTQWEADTDVGIVDEYLIRLALRWRLLRRQGLSYQEELDECEREVAKAVARDGGAATMSLVPALGLHLLSPDNIPETGFGPANN